MRHEASRKSWIANREFNMKYEEQRIAIAKACGWIKTSEPEEVYGVTFPWISDDGESYKYLPDYLYDLNAMHEAEKHCIYIGEEIDTDLIAEYLMNVVIAAPPGRSQSASPRQRAEALLRTIGKWR